MDEWVEGWLNEWTVESWMMEELVGGSIDRLDGWMDRWMVGWMNGWMDDEWTEYQLSRYGSLVFNRALLALRDTLTDVWSCLSISTTRSRTEKDMRWCFKGRWVKTQQSLPLSIMTYYSTIQSQGVCYSSEHYHCFFKLPCL